MFYQLIACCIFISSLNGAQPAPKKRCIRDNNVQPLVASSLSMTLPPVESNLILQESERIAEQLVSQLGRFICMKCYMPHTAENYLKQHERMTHGSVQDQFIYAGVGCSIFYCRHSQKPAAKKRYICFIDNCKKRYVDENHLQVHIRARHSNERFACSFPGCAKDYLYSHSLKAHIKRVHSHTILPPDAGLLSEVPEIPDAPQGLFSDEVIRKARDIAAMADYELDCPEEEFPLQSPPH